MKTPGHGGGAGVGEAAVEREFDGTNVPTIGGLRKYEAEKRRILDLPLTPREYEAQCRQIAEKARV
jgi:hypothetical protein